MDKEIYYLVDELASKGWTTISEVLRRYYGHHIDSDDSRRINFNRKLERTHKKFEVFEFKDKDFRGPFRFKKGIKQPYFARQRDDKRTESLEGDEKRLYLTSGLNMLLDNETAAGGHMIELECIDRFRNLELIKVLAEHLAKREIITFRYYRSYEEVMERTIHPHLLKQYNGRWFIFGYVEPLKEKNEIVNFALDRILENICDHRKSDQCQLCKWKKEKKDICPMNHNIHYKGAPWKSYEIYFKNIVGVTKKEGVRPETIKFRTTNEMVHNLINTKPIHPSQVERLAFDEDKGYGEFSLRVCPNIELQTKLLSYGDGVYVWGEGDFQDQIRAAVTKMAKNYLTHMTKKLHD